MKGGAAKLFAELADRAREYNGVANIAVRYSNRPDLHALVLLDSLVPGKGNMIIGAEHDQVWLAVDVEELDEVLTPALALELSSCGVFISSEGGSLSMFV